MKKHIIFDFDDTISSAYEHNQQLFVDTFLKHKSDIDQDYVRKVHFVNRGTSMELQFNEVIKKFDMKISSQQLVEENEKLHRQKAGEITIFAGFEDILKHFEKLGKIISLCTNRAEGSLKIILKNNNMEKYFDNVVSCKDEKHEKPDPYCLNQLLKKYPKISKEETIYYGDSKTDAEFAQNAGIDYLVIDHYLNKKQFFTLALSTFAGGEDELLVEVNKNDQDIGVIYKMEAHSDITRFHRAAHVMLFNSKGNAILQQRSLSKSFDPGAWDMPGGHQTFGQTIEQTATIELSEEMGIKPELNFVKKRLKQDDIQSEWGYLYYAISDGPYKYDEHEVAKVKEFDCQKLLNHEYDKDCPILKHIYIYIEELRNIWEPLKKV